MHRGRRSAAVLACLTGLAALSAALPAGAVTVKRTLDFQTSGQSIWSGAAPVFEEVLAETFVGPNLSAPFLLDFGAFGQYGVSGNFALGINVGLNTRLSNFHQGSVDVRYPVEVLLDMPAKAAPGQTFTVGSSFFVQPEASFQAVASSARLDIGAKSGLQANLGVKACFGGCFLDETPVDLNAPFGTLDLVTQTRDSTVINIDVPGFGKPTIAGDRISIDPGDPINKPLEFAISQVTNVSGDISVPDHQVTGTLQAGGALKSSDTDIFTDVNVDLDGFTPAGKALGIDPVTIGPLTFGYNILDATLNTKLIERQMLEFIGTPVITLDAGPLGSFEFLAGESIELTMPEHEDVELSASFSLANSFTNTTAVAAAQAFVITAGQLILNLPSFQITPDIPSITIPGTPSFCAIPNPFGGCILRIPAVPSITIPGVDGLEFAGVNFNETAFQRSFADQLLTDLAGFDLDTCTVAPGACEFLPLFGLNGAQSSALYSSTRSLAFDSIGGGSFRVRNEVPEPSSMALMGGAILLLAAGRSVRRTYRPSGGTGRPVRG